MTDAALVVGAGEAAQATQILLGRGEPLAAFNASQQALQHWPHDTRLRQLQALALARSGDAARANHLLQRLAEEGLADAETWAMLARTHKDLAQRNGDAQRAREHLDAALRLYLRAYRAARRQGQASEAIYAGINAAAMAKLRGAGTLVQRLAVQVRTLASGTAAAIDPYWREATLGEAALLLGDEAGATRHYLKAVGLAQGRWGDLGSTRRQARWLAALDGASNSAMLQGLRMPPVLVCTGHMMDAPGRTSARFTAEMEPGVRQALGAKMTALAPLAVYASAACGVDILCLELAHEMGLETHVVLPFPPAEFRRSSVDFAGAEWGERFESVLERAASLTITSDHAAKGSAASFDYANRVVTGMALLRAQTLDTHVSGLVAWNPHTTGGAGGAASHLVMWRQLGLPVDAIELPGALPEQASRPAATSAAVPAMATTRHELRSMLFADAVGYSQLSEDQIPGYIEGFLGAVAALRRRTAHGYEHVETAGDGLYMVFAEAGDAAHFALELSALTRALDRRALGLPDNFALRIALHCGPVHCARDPLTERPLYTGPHTSRTARIEPVTPPGQVYASSAFAAVAAAGGVTDLTMHYVGRMPLAKGYGTLGLYHLSPTAL